MHAFDLQEQNSFKTDMVLEKKAKELEGKRKKIKGTFFVFFFLLSFFQKERQDRENELGPYLENKKRKERRKKGHHTFLSFFAFC